MIRSCNSSNVYDQLQLITYTLIVISYIGTFILLQLKIIYLLVLCKDTNYRNYLCTVYKNRLPSPLTIPNTYSYNVSDKNCCLDLVFGHFRTLESFLCSHLWPIQTHFPKHFIILFSGVEEIEMLRDLLKDLNDMYETSPNSKNRRKNEQKVKTIDFILKSFLVCICVISVVATATCMLLNVCETLRRKMSTILSRSNHYQYILF